MLVKSIQIANRWLANTLKKPNLDRHITYSNILLECSISTKLVLIIYAKLCHNNAYEIYFESELLNIQFKV